MSNIVVGITGGIAAYKTAHVVSRLVQGGHDVSVVMSQSAKNFVGPATFTALTGKPVGLKSFDPKFPLGAHIELAREADLFCVAPATANFIGKTANGIADDLITTLYLCCTCPVLMAPAMNCEMWDKQSVQRNVKQLVADGVSMIDPQEGWLSCRVKGVGRMAEPETILEAIQDRVSA